MKEDKKTVHKSKNNTAKKNNTQNKKHNDTVKKNNTNKKSNQNVSEAPRVTKIESPVKETRKVVVEDEFIEEDNDKKLIVVIAIAILVILATIIGLLVGCEKQEEKPEEPNDDEIVVPVQVDDGEEDEDDVVVKVSTNKSDEEEDEEVAVIPTYNIVYYYEGDRTHHETADEGTAANKYVPDGYSTCTYHKDAEFAEEYEFDNLYEDVNIYLDCETITYTVVYEEGLTHGNPTEFTVLDEKELMDPETEEIFVGWYLDNEFTQEVTMLDRNLIKHANAENEVYLYAKTVTEVNVKLYGTEETPVYNETFEKGEVDGYTLPDAAELGVCETSSFLGWTSAKETKNVDYKNGTELELNKNYELYAVCGDATIVYTSNGETVTVGYTNQELADAGFDLPEPSTMGIETPVYFVPVDEETLTSKKIVSDDEIELGENEVYFSQVVDNVADNYVPNVGDNVEVFEKEFVGWIEKTEEVTTPEEETTPEVGTEETPTEGTEGTEETPEIEVEEEVVVLTPEEVKELLENDKDSPAEVELEAVWEIPSEETTEDTEVEPTTPETETEVEETPVLPVA